MDRINVTKTFLPPIEEYETYVRQIWESGQLTNQGPLLKEFEQKASALLGVENFHFVTNGTIALQLALRALNITEGEVITTPFSYVATTSSILWENCTPVFVDIKPDTFCIDAEKIEAAITPNTRAIMPVHVFGYPCDVEVIDALAKKHNLKVIYDAAHAFGVTYKGRPLLSYGDISTCSFHATKAFHTIEGGAVIVKDKSVSEKVELLKRFGHNGDEHRSLGINGKVSEFHAAMGLCNLNYIESNLKARRQLFDLYQSLLSDKVYTPKPSTDGEANYIYYPIVLNSGTMRQRVTTKLEESNIYPRRYFYPSLNKLPYINNTQECPISEDITGRIICLPFYVGLEESAVKKVADIVNSCVVDEA